MHKLSHLLTTIELPIHVYYHLGVIVEVSPTKVTVFFSHVLAELTVYDAELTLLAPLPNISTQ